MISTQEIRDYEIIVAAAKEHLRSIESIINISNIPKDAREQAKERTLSWAAQYKNHLSNDYLKMVAVASLMAAHDILATELELSLNKEFIETRTIIWEGIKDALDHAPKESFLKNIVDLYKSTLSRVENTEYDNKSIKFTTDFNGDNIDYALSINCNGLPFEQGKKWLAHNMMLLSDTDTLNKLITEFNTEYKDYLDHNIKILTPIQYQRIKLKNPDEIFNFIGSYQLKNYTPEKESKHKDGVDDNMPSELYSTLVSTGALDLSKKRKKVSYFQTPSEFMDEFAKTKNISLLTEEQWISNGSSREEIKIVQNVNYKKQSNNVGVAQYILIGTNEKDDIRIEIKNQHSSGGSASRLPTTIFGLDKANKEGLYKSTFVGVLNTTHYTDTTLECTELVLNSCPRITFSMEEDVSKDLANIIEEQLKLFIQTPIQENEILKDLGLIDDDFSFGSEP